MMDKDWMDLTDVVLMQSLTVVFQDGFFAMKTWSFGVNPVQKSLLLRGAVS